MKTALINLIIVGVIQAEWELSTSFNCYHRKGYEYVMSDATNSIVETFIKKLITQQGDLNHRSYGFMIGHGNADAIFILTQFQEE